MVRADLEGARFDRRKGLPESVIRSCHAHVSLPSIKYASFNVAVAVSMAYSLLCSTERNPGIDHHV
eukprot:745995-Hanusia_phi.AAC.2